MISTWCSAHVAGSVSARAALASAIDWGKSRLNSLVRCAGSERLGSGDFETTTFNNSVPKGGPIRQRKRSPFSAEGIWIASFARMRLSVCAEWEKP